MGSNFKQLVKPIYIYIYTIIVFSVGVVFVTVIQLFDTQVGMKILLTIGTSKGYICIDLKTKDVGIVCKWKMISNLGGPRITAHSRRDCQDIMFFFVFWMKYPPRATVEINHSKY